MENGFEGFDGFDLLRILIDTLPDQLYVKDAEGRFVVNNIKHAKDLGAASPEEIAGKTDFDFYPKELAEQYRADEREVIRSGRPLIGKEGPGVDEEGNRSWHSTTKVPLRNGSGEIVGLVGMTQDITERKRAQEEPQKSYGILRAVTEGTTDAVYVKDRRSRYLMVNSACARFLEKSVEEIVGKDDTQLFSPDTGRQIVEADQRIMAAGETQTFEEIGTVGGTTRTYLTTKGAYRDDQGNVIGVFGVSRDITERKQTEEELKESEERFRSAFEDAPIGVALVSAERRFLRVNRALCEMLGYSKEELLEKTTAQITHSDDLEASAERTHRALEGEAESSHLEKRYVHADGHVVWALSSISLIRDSRGNPSHFVSFFQDMTERKEAEKALRESEERFRTVFEDAPVGVSLVGLDGRRLKVNRALCKMLGYSEEDLVGKDYLEIIHPEDRESSAERMRRALERGPERYTVERRYIHADGHVVWVLSSVSLIRDSQGDPSHLVCLHQDLTDRKALEEQLRHQAFHDSMTGLPTRALFLDRLEHALARTSREGGSVAVLMVDLDDFKVINDSLGHDAGNAVLVEAAERLRSSVRLGDTVGRIFGDEFAVLLEAPSGMEEARRVTGRIEERLQQPFEAEGQEVFVAPSIGIAEGDTAEDRPKEILRHADLAMYAAKKRGKARYEVYTTGMSTRVTERMDLENELRRAIEREEFEVHYQPTVELNTGKIVSLEALARWKHPERGLIAAEDFIQVAEETGLIRPIGQWVIEEACRQAKEWREQYPDRDPLVSVNLSANQFTNQPNLIPEVLDDTELEPSALEIEITERAVMDDAEFSLGKLQRLKSLGVRFAIDDYGMGYSCLYYLKRMPLDSLKIERSFIAGLGEDPGAEAIVWGAVSLAHALGLKVVAEGVETERQLAKLKELGCDLAQGFHLAKPLPSRELSKLLAEDRHW